MTFLLSLFFLIFAIPSYGFDARLQWDANNEPDLSGYKIYYKTQTSGPPYMGTDINQKDSPIDIGPQIATNGKITYDLFGLSDSMVYYIAITAYDNAGNESHFSNEINTEQVSTMGDNGADKSFYGCFIESVTIKTVFYTFNNNNVVFFITLSTLTMFFQKMYKYILKKWRELCLLALRYPHIFLWF